jgi:sulfopyruvate decarboxylase TPP-binding subunit
VIKAVEFLDYICNELDYRFFAGIPCGELSLLYNKMKSDFMHYVPVTSEEVALGLSSGVWLSGFKSGILLHINNIYDILKCYDLFNEVYKVPVLLIVGYGSDDDLKIMTKFKIAYKVMGDDYQKQLKVITNKLEKQHVPCAIMVKEGELK